MSNRKFTWKTATYLLYAVCFLRSLEQTHLDLFCFQFPYLDIGYFSPKWKMLEHIWIKSTPNAESIIGWDRSRVRHQIVKTLAVTVGVPQYHKWSWVSTPPQMQASAPPLKCAIKVWWSIYSTKYEIHWWWAPPLTNGDVYRLPNAGECPHPLKCVVKLWRTRQTPTWKLQVNRKESLYFLWWKNKTFRKFGYLNWIWPWWARLIAPTKKSQKNSRNKKTKQNKTKQINNNQTKI